MRRIGIALLGTALLCACACGSEEAPQGAGQPMAGPAVERAQPARRENQKPVVDELRLRPSNPRPGETLSVEASASDPDGDALRLDYVWRVNGQRMPQSGSSLVLAAHERNSLIEVSVVARDGVDESEPARAQARVGNQPPQLLAIAIEPLQDVTAGHDILATPRATDPDGDEIEFRYAWQVDGEPVGDGEPRLAATHFARGDRIRLEVIASDGQDESEPLESADIVVGNAAPRITSTPGSFDADGSFRYQLEVADPDGDRLFRYRLVSGPEGLELDPVSGRVLWQPSREQVGTHPVLVEVDDRAGGIASQSFEIRVQEQVETLPAAPARGSNP